MKRYLVLAEGHSGDPHHGKTARGVIRYAPHPVVAIVDSEPRGRDVRGHPGRRHGRRRARRRADDGARRRRRGRRRAAAASGAGSSAPRLEAGLDVEAGMHAFLADDPELAELARRARRRAPRPAPAARRPQRPDRREPAARRDRRPHGRLRLRDRQEDHGPRARPRGAARAASRSVFVPTGQTGIVIAGWGIAVDAVVADFLAGAAERLVVEGARRGDLLWVEGQGSLLHPQYSGVTLGLYHGARAAPPRPLPHGRATTQIEGFPGHPIPPLAELVELYERLALPGPAGAGRGDRAEHAAPRRRGARTAVDDARRRPVWSPTTLSASARDGCWTRSSSVLPSGITDGVTDPRVDAARPASSSTTHSSSGEGQVLRIDAPDVGVAARARPLPRGARAGAHPVHERQPSTGLAESCSTTAPTSSSTYVSPLQRHEIETIDALVTIWSETNTRSLSRGSTPTGTRATSARSASSRTAAGSASRTGEMRWCGTLFPTNAHAQDAEMSLAEYEDFVYGACHVGTRTTRPRTGARVAAALEARAAELESRPRAPHRRARHRPARRRRRAARGSPPTGAYNMPDGEVFTSPVETETEGEIRFTFPAIYHGREVEDVRLRFEGGRVVARGGRARRRLPAARCSTWTTAPASSARSRSGSTTRSTASPATSSSTRRSAGRCTSRSAPASRRPAARTRPGCTGT